MCDTSVWVCVCDSVSRYFSHSKIEKHESDFQVWLVEIRNLKVRSKSEMRILHVRASRLLQIICKHASFDGVFINNTPASSLCIIPFAISQLSWDFETSSSSSLRHGHGPAVISRNADQHRKTSSRCPFSFNLANYTSNFNFTLVETSEQFHHTVTIL